MRAFRIWIVAHSKIRLDWLSHGGGVGRNGLVDRCRGCHDSSGKSPTVKEELRRLYKLVHPDLFHFQPVQQATNEKSFQLLQEYLNAAKGGDGSKRFVYRFQFYIRDKTSEDLLKKVEISLPSPEVRGQGHTEHDFLPATRRAIGKLFAACGLSCHLTAGDERVSLPNLFQEASELQRQNESSQLGLQQRLSLLSNALMLGRGVKVLFRAPVEDSLVAVQIQLLEKLAMVLDGSSEINFNGSTFVFGNCYRTDVQGRLWLHWEDNCDMWAQFMRQADLLLASSRRVSAKTRQYREEKLATLMCVEMILPDDSLSLHPNYLLFLQRMEDGALECGPVGKGKFSELLVRVGDVKECKVDEKIGCVTVPVSEEFSSLYKFIEQKGIEALEQRKKLKQRESRLEDMRKHLRIRLRLRHLTFDRKLSSDQIMSACTRLLSHARRLTAFSEGLSLCISDEYRLPSATSGNALQMKWDFSSNDL